jgi:hypothetical protein
MRRWLPPSGGTCRKRAPPVADAGTTRLRSAVAGNGLVYPKCSAWTTAIACTVTAAGIPRQNNNPGAGSQSCRSSWAQGACPLPPSRQRRHDSRRTGRGARDPEWPDVHDYPYAGAAGPSRSGAYFRSVRQLDA